MHSTLPEIQSKLSELFRNKEINKSLIFDVLKIYDISPITISKLRTGSLNASNIKGEFLRKNLVYIKFAEKNENIQKLAFSLKNSESALRLKPKFIIVLNDTELAAVNFKNPNETLICDIENLEDHAEFFFELTGRKIDRSTREESYADRRAAEKMNLLYDEIEKKNIEIITKGGSQIRHDLNVFFSRLLFCLFAEDTGIFKNNQFSSAIQNYTEKDGTGIKQFFESLFQALDLREREREREREFSTNQTI